MAVDVVQGRVSYARERTHVTLRDDGWNRSHESETVFSCFVGDVAVRMTGELDIQTGDFVTAAGVQQGRVLQTLAIRNDVTNTLYCDGKSSALLIAIGSLLVAGIVASYGGIWIYVGLAFVAAAAWYGWRWQLIREAEAAAWVAPRQVA